MPNLPIKTKTSTPPIASYRARLASTNASESSSSISSSPPPAATPPSPARSREASPFSNSAGKMSNATNLAQIRHTDRFIEVGPNEPNFESSKLLQKTLWESAIKPSDKFVPFVAVHAHGDYLAFTKAIWPSSDEQIEIDEDVKEAICLYHCTFQRKGTYHYVKGHIVDMAFAHLSHRILLGVLNDIGEIMIGEIGPRSSISGSLYLIRVLQINPSFEVLVPLTLRRMAWTPFIMDEDEPTGSELTRALVVAVASNSFIDVFSLSEPLELLKGQSVSENSLANFRIRIDLNCVVTRVKISPDASALVVATAKKGFKLYAIDFDQPLGQQYECPSPSPNLGEDSIISSLWFPDDHAFAQSSALFWKHIIVAFEQNSKICLYSCDSWQLVQSVKVPKVAGGYHMTMATSGDRFVLFSPNHPKFYVVYLEVKVKGEESEAWFSSVKMIEMPDSFKLLIVAPNSTAKNTKLLGFCNDDLKMVIIPHGLPSKRSKTVSFEVNGSGSELDNSNKITPKKNESPEPLKGQAVVLQPPTTASCVKFDKQSESQTLSKKLQQESQERIEERSTEILIEEFNTFLRSSFTTILTQEMTKSSGILKAGIEKLINKFFQDQTEYVPNLMANAVGQNFDEFSKKIVEATTSSTVLTEKALNQFRNLLAKGLHGEAVDVLVQHPDFALRGLLEMDLIKKLQKRELDHRSEVLLRLCHHLVKDLATYPTTLMELFEEVAVVVNRSSVPKPPVDNDRVLFEILDASERFLAENPTFHKDREMRRMQMVVKSVADASQHC